MSDDELLELALGQRPDLTEARSAVEIAWLRAGIAERRLLPDLRVGVNVSLVGRGEGFDDSLSLNESVVSLVLSADLPLARREAESQLNIAQVGHTRAEYALARLEKGARRELGLLPVARVQLHERSVLHRHLLTPAPSQVGHNQCEAQEVT